MAEINGKLTTMAEIKGSIATGSGGEVITIKGDKGDKGDSAYECAVKDGFVGTMTEWLASLVGAKGEQGIQGERGLQGIQGVAGEKGEQGIQGEQGLKGDKGDQGADGIQGIQGERGLQGEQGVAGTNGSDGYTPVRTVDYWTTADIQAIETELKTWAETEILGGAD